ncbi:polysaccharide biosynthesis tyrosine autokinase [Shewanella sp. Isolate11]|uniref:polysaccharide biosynthesis tyrosine autokinase n=1 Tax=Shewanella sp. Isolate11 TaxID=2908530 RepID=UPI001EFC47EC|nr:polysaccharide biosynthesis tyrosine autokinase [Shewanella sp. Isolate11]MCG9698371.1 polysaccharide biosynthesis tyrosine autokinase [Shewanella sp. Isolate11]
MSSTKPIHTSSARQNNQQQIDLIKLMGTLIDARWFIICLTLLFTIFGAAYVLLATPIYKADALIQVESKSSDISALVGDMGDMFSSESSSVTEIEIIKSRMILGQTVDKFNLTTQIKPGYLPAIGQGLARLTKSEIDIDIPRFFIPGYIDLPAKFSFIVDNADVGSYSVFDEESKKILSGKVGELATKGEFAVFVRQIDASTGDSFAIEKQSKMDAVQWLQENLSISERGKDSGILLLSFVGENKADIETILDDIAQNYFLQNVERSSAEAEQSLAFLQGHLPDIKHELTLAEDNLNQYRQAHESVDLSLEAQSKLKVMVELEAQLNELTFKESDISQRYTKDHPAYISLLDKRNVLLEEKSKLNQQIQDLPLTQREILRLTRDVEVNQAIYIQLLGKVQELSVLKAGTVGNVRILDEAQAYTEAVKPKKLLVVVVAILLGGFIAVALVLVNKAIHKGVESPDQIEELGIPVYASIPLSQLQNQLEQKIKRTKIKTSLNVEETLLSESNPADLSIEALRGLRTSMHFAMLEAKNNVVMITGPSPSIGKSFVTANLGGVIANAGQKVLIIDGDMRKGYLQRHFNLKYDDGLSDLLVGKSTAEEVVKSTGVDNLDVITRGIVPPNPSELLMHPRFKQFLAWASEQYDLVLIDTPPVLAVTDPSIVGALAGTTLMVGRFEVSTAKEIEIAHHRFEMAGIEVKGFILNAVEKKASSTYGYGYYNYSYQSDK